MLRWSAILSFLLLLALAGLTVEACFGPLRFMPYDSYGKLWFPRDTEPVSCLEDLNEPGFPGRYGSPNWDCGIFPFILYIRQTEHVPSQTMTNTGPRDIDDSPYETYEHHLPLGILWKRVWHQGDTSAFVAIPVWLLFMVLSICPACQVGRYLRRRRSAGMCATCHYDLRAHSPGQKCPECGTPIPSCPPTLRNG